VTIALLDFVMPLRNLAPFNAMLLQVQKPGLRYAASATDWWTRFGRKPKDGARPLLILWPFGPIALVYDVADTEGKELPQDVAAFVAHGPIRETEIEAFRQATNRKNIFWDDLDAGDGKAGSIRCTRKATMTKNATNTGCWSTTTTPHWFGSRHWLMNLRTCSSGILAWTKRSTCRIVAI
jgi:hypothetical protein